MSVEIKPQIFTYWKDRLAKVLDELEEPLEDDDRPVDHRCGTTEEQDDPIVCDISQSSATADADDTTPHGDTTDDEHTTTCLRINMRHRTKQYVIMWSVFAIMVLCLFGVTQAIGDTLSCYSCGPMADQRIKCRAEERCAGKYCLKVVQTSDSGTKILRQCVNYDITASIKPGTCLENKARTWEGITELSCVCDTPMCNRASTTTTYVGWSALFILPLLTAAQARFDR